MPKLKQWKNWSLPSKLTFIGTYLTIISLVITVYILASENIKLKNENLIIVAGPMLDNVPLKWVEGYGNQQRDKLILTHPITFANNGFSPISLLNYSITPINCDYEYPIGNDGDLGMYKEPTDLNPINFPIAILPGDSKTFYVKISTLIVENSKINNTLKEFYSDPTIFDLKKITLLSYRSEEDFSSLDIFENKTDYVVGVRGLTSFNSYMDSLYDNQPVYKLQIKTAKSKIYNLEFGPYSLDKVKPFKRCNEKGPFIRDENFLRLDAELMKYFYPIK